MPTDPDLLERRAVLAAIGVGLPALIAGCGPKRGDSQSPGDPGGGGAGGGDGGATDDGDGGDGGDACDATSDDIEGPYYREDIPERADIATASEDGTALAITGLITDTDCAPIPGARIEFWQADVGGAYDTESDDAHYYGWQVADAEGRYALTTYVPGRYLNGDTYRPAHIHVKILVGGVERLTTQLYFDGDPYNEADPWYDESQSIALADDGAGGQAGAFDFAVS